MAEKHKPDPGAMMLDLAGEPFHVRVDGPSDAPALLLSNPLSFNLSMWDPQVPALAQKFRVVRYDSRGHGKSPAPARPYSMAELARDALNLLDALGIEKAHFCGLSLGGMVGQWLLSHAPHRLGKAILANTAAHMPPPELWNGRIRFANQNGLQAILDPTIQRWFTKDFIERAPETIAEVRAMIVGTPLAGYAGCCAAVRDMDQREAIRAVVNPVLVVIGRHDPGTTPAMGELIASRIPDARTAVLEAAHISNIEAPEDFTRTVLGFLEG